VSINLLHRLTRHRIDRISMTKIALVEQDLKSLLSHHYEYAKSLSRAATEASISFLILGNIEAAASVCNNGVLPVLSHGRLSRRKRTRLGLLTKIDFLVNNYYCYIDLLRFLKRNGPCDCLFFPTASHYQLFAIWLLFLFHPKLTRSAVVFFVQQCTIWPLTESRPILDKVAGILRLQLKLLAPMVRKRRIVLAVETPVAREEYQQLTGLNFQLWGHPVQVQPSSISPDSQRIVFASLGPARFEKGSDILLQAIELCINEPLFDQVFFIVQWPGDFDLPDGSTQTIPKHLVSHGRVRWLTQPLDHDTYINQLVHCSAVILPYRPCAYYGRLSRVSIEAAASGIPIIATRGTHAESVIGNHGAGVVMEDASASSLIDAMATFIRERTLLVAAARAAAAEVSHLNSPTTFLQTILRTVGR
jgi:glycosyltransferase involved in cell wall biosynthesis